MKANATRNKQLVELRDKDPKQNSFRELARIFRINTSTAFEIYHREKAKKSKRAKRPQYLLKKYPKLGVGSYPLRGA